MGSVPLSALVAAGVLALVVIGQIALVAALFRYVEQGKALVVTPMRGEPVVSFTGRIVYPIVNKAETMDLSLKKVKIERRGWDGLACKDGVRADLKVAFYLRVNRTAEDVLKVAQWMGCARASDPAAVEELFREKFSDALETVARGMRFEELDMNREQFKDRVLETIGSDLNGFVLDDMALDHVEKTPLEALRKGDNTTPGDSNGISA